MMSPHESLPGLECTTDSLPSVTLLQSGMAKSLPAVSTYICTSLYTLALLLITIPRTTSYYYHLFILYDRPSASIDIATVEYSLAPKKS